MFVAAYSETGLAGLEFPTAVGSARRADSRDAGQRGVPTNSIRRWHEITVKALKTALTGRTPVGLPPLDMSSGTAFQRRVWSALRKIRPGQTRSYAEVANAIGRPRSARAVGGACGANPIPVLIPCHRVVSANGGLGGFSAGLKWKRLLLAREGIQLD